MLVKDLAMELWRMRSNGDVSDDNAYNLIDFEEAVSQSTAFVIEQQFWINYKLTGRYEINENYLQVIEGNEVKYNSVRDRYYIECPDVISFPDNLGVFFVGQNMALTDPFPRLTFGNAGFYTRNPNDITSWIMTEKTIQFENFNPTIKEIVIAIIPAKPEIVNGDDAQQVRELVLKQFGTYVNVIHDKVNNSNDNTIKDNG